MDTNKTLREHISALVDGELPEADAELALAALQEEDGKEVWGLYHLIKDTLRAAPAPDLSPGFAQGLRARLALEPAPLPPGSGDGRGDSRNDVSNGSRNGVSHDGGDDSRNDVSSDSHNDGGNDSRNDSRHDGGAEPTGLAAALSDPGAP